MVPYMGNNLRIENNHGVIHRNRFDLLIIIDLSRSTQMGFQPNAEAIFSVVKTTPRRVIIKKRLVDRMPP